MPLFYNKNRRKPLLETEASAEALTVLVEDLLVSKLTARLPLTTLPFQGLWLKKEKPRTFGPKKPDFLLTSCTLLTFPSRPRDACCQRDANKGKAMNKI